MTLLSGPQASPALRCIPALPISCFLERTEHRTSKRVTITSYFFFCILGSCVGVVVEFQRGALNPRS